MICTGRGQVVTDFFFDSIYSNMNTLYHFGDSYGKCDQKETLFSYYIGDHFDLHHKPLSVVGYSNLSIFSDILSYTHEFKPKDMILVNWSFFTRVDIPSEKIRIDGTRGFMNHSHEFFDKHFSPYANWVIDGIHYIEEESTKFFYMVDKYFQSLHTIGVESYHTFITQPKFTYLANRLDFQPSYYRWLVNKKWKDEESQHYSWGIQEELGKEYIKRINIIKGIQ